MKKKIIIGVIVVMGLVSILGNLFVKKENMSVEVAEGTVEESESKTKEVVKGEYAFLQDILSCDEKKANAIMMEFEKTTNSTFTEAEQVPTNNKSKVLKVNCDGKIYYLKISARNVLREIYEDSLSGKCIYQIIY